MKSKKTVIQRRVPFIDLSTHFTSSIDNIDQLPRPRTIKTHLPSHFFDTQLGQGQMKVIVVMRNPKDTLVSYYHFYRMNKGYEHYKGTWDDYFEIVKARELVYGDWFEHVIKWWRIRDSPNVLIVKFEDIKNNPMREVRKMATFMGKSYDDATMDAIVKHTSFNSMKANPCTNGTVSPFLNNTISAFIRKGEVGDWKNYFSEEQNKYIEHRIKTELDPIGLHFDFN